MKLQLFFRRCALLAILVLFLGMVGCKAKSGSVQTEGNMPTRVVRGNLYVRYEVQNTEGTSSSVEIRNATSIYIGDTLIIIQERYGEGRVIPVAKLNYLHWK